MLTLCGNTWCQHNDKQLGCLIGKGLADFGYIEEVERTNDQELIRKAYEGCELYEEDTLYVKSLNGI
jgi:hypothetical protein